MARPKKKIEEKPDLSDAVDSLENEKAALEERVKSLEDSNSRLEVVAIEVENLREEKEKDRAALSGAQETIEGLQATIRDLTSKNESVHDSLMSMSEKAVSLQKKVDEQTVLIKALKDNVPEEQAKNRGANEFDPRQMVEIVEISVKGVSPIQLRRPSPAGKGEEIYEPEFDKLGATHYRLPRDYAETQLSNNGGRRYVLVFPRRLKIRMPNARLGFDVVEIEASEDYLPIMM